MALHLKSTGIDFADFGGSATSELLNDYEHGTWTLTASGTGSIGGGGAAQRYVKVGQVVTATIDYIVASGGTLTSLGGLPITNGADRQGGVVGYNSIIATVLGIYSPSGATNIALYSGSTNTATIGQDESMQACLMTYTSF